MISVLLEAAGFSRTFASGGWVADRSDYWNLMCGLTLIVLAVICYFLSDQRRETPAWRWLATFGLSQGIYHWMEMLTVSLGDCAAFALFRLALLILSSLFLAEAGRRSLAGLGKKRRSLLIMAALVILAGLGGVAGLRGLNLSVRLFLCLGGGLWSGWALWRALPPGALCGCTLRLAGCGLAAYVAAFCLDLPALVLQAVQGRPNASLLHLFSLSLQARTLLMAGVTVALWYYFSKTCLWGRGNAPRGRLLEYWLGPVLLATALAGAVGIEMAGRYRDDEMRALLLSRTRTVAASVSHERLAHLHGSGKDVETREYQFLKGMLIAVRHADARCRFSYVTVLRGNDVVILADSEPPDSKDYSPPGQIYVEASETLRSSLRNGKESVEGPLPDRWGVWVSSFVPIVDPQTNGVIAVVGQDTDAGDWRRSIGLYRLLAISVILLVALLAIVFFVIQLRGYESARAIEGSERRYRQMFADNPALMLLIDPNSGRILDANPAACVYYGYTAGGLQNRDFCEIDEGSPEELLAEMKKGLSARYLNFTSRHRLRSGETREVEIRGGPVEMPSGTVLYCVIHDVTERSQAEENLRKAKDSAESLNVQLENAIAQANSLAVEAELANQAKSQFLATMSHEIRTPLNGLIGLTHLLTDSGLTAPQMRLVEMLRTSGNALLTVINDVLDFSKIEAGKLEMEAVEFDPAGSVRDTLEILGAHAKDKGLLFSADVDPDIPHLVRGDPGCLRRILLNLAGNAIKFTARGRVLIECKTESEDEHRITLRFSVSDTGIGIAPHRIDRLFQPFSQVDSSTTRKFGGTGLGLIISKRLSEMMGGQIGVNSEYGKGTTFWFTAGFEKTMARSEPSIIPMPKENRDRLRGLRVLVVDDDEINQVVAQGILENAGCQVELAGCGKAAIDAIENRIFDIVLMDVRMPDMDGFEAAATIRRAETNSQRSHVPIIALTAQLGKAETDRCRAVAMNACLSKPVDPTALLNEIEKVLHCPDPVISFDPEPGSTIAKTHTDVFDPESLLERIGGDAAVFDRLVSIFRMRAPQHSAAMQEAFAAADLPQLRHEAHALRGAAANMSARKVAAIAQEIETAAGGGDLESTRPLLDSLIGELQQLERELSNLSNAPHQWTERKEQCAF